MKATELMIGDAVIDSYNRTIRIDSIDKNNITYKYYESGNYGEECTKKDLLIDIRPIPLTPEILEKNGWVNKKEKGWTQKGNFGDSPLMLWYIKDTGKFIPHFAHELEMSDLSKDGGFHIKVQCNYLHELQHTFRLCGLNELADNFKV